MLMTAGRIKIMYFSKLLTIKLKKTFKILKKYIIFFMKKYMNSRQYIMNYCIDLDIVGGYCFRLIKYDLETWNLYLDT